MLSERGRADFSGDQIGKRHGGGKAEHASEGIARTATTAVPASAVPSMIHTSSEIFNICVISD
jgi:hypothetical protein